MGNLNKIKQRSKLRRKITKQQNETQIYESNYRNTLLKKSVTLDAYFTDFKESKEPYNVPEQYLKAFSLINNNKILVKLSIKNRLKILDFLDFLCYNKLENTELYKFTLSEIRNYPNIDIPESLLILFFNSLPILGTYLPKYIMYAPTDLFTNLTKYMDVIYYKSLPKSKRPTMANVVACDNVNLFDHILLYPSVICKCSYGSYHNYNCPSFKMLLDIHAVNSVKIMESYLKKIICRRGRHHIYLSSQLLSNFNECSIIVIQNLDLLNVQYFGSIINISSTLATDVFIGKFYFDTVLTIYCDYVRTQLSASDANINIVSDLAIDYILSYCFPYVRYGIFDTILINNLCPDWNGSYLCTNSERYNTIIIDLLTRIATKLVHMDLEDDYKKLTIESTTRYILSAMICLTRKYVTKNKTIYERNKQAIKFVVRHIERFKLNYPFIMIACKNKNLMCIKYINRIYYTLDADHRSIVVHCIPKYICSLPLTNITIFNKAVTYFPQYIVRMELLANIFDIEDASSLFTNVKNYILYGPYILYKTYKIRKLYDDDLIRSIQSIDTLIYIFFLFVSCFILGGFICFMLEFMTYL